MRQPSEKEILNHASEIAEKGYSIMEGVIDNEFRIQVLDELERLGIEYDQIALVAILRSPLFMIDDESLLKLRASNINFMKSLEAVPKNLPIDVTRRCRHAWSVLSELSWFANKEPVDTLVGRA